MSEPSPPAENSRAGMIWVAALAAALVLLGLVLAALASTGPLAPFLYPLM